MKALILFALLINVAQAEGLYLTPLTPPDLRGMCEKFPDACKKAPTVVEPIQPAQPIAPLMSRKKCIDDKLYYEVIISGESVWKPIHDIDGLIKACKN